LVDHCSAGILIPPTSLLVSLHRSSYLVLVVVVGRNYYSKPTRVYISRRPILLLDCGYIIVVRACGMHVAAHSIDVTGVCPSVGHTYVHLNYILGKCEPTDRASDRPRPAVSGSRISIATLLAHAGSLDHRTTTMTNKMTKHRPGRDLTHTHWPVTADRYSVIDASAGPLAVRSA